LHNIRWLQLPEQAPTVSRFIYEVLVCFIAGDFLIYTHHRIMHAVPFFRNHIHNVHHKYHHPFSWAGGWVHPVEDAIVIWTQMVTPMCIIDTHPLTVWFFVTLWVAFLMEEHSGHDVWWSPWALLPFGWGGGAVPHDIHHVKPLKNLGFVLTVWDRMFGTYEEPEPRQVSHQLDKSNVNFHQGPMSSFSSPFLSNISFSFWCRSVTRSAKDVDFKIPVKLPYGVW
jgi:sterol desaturase/sphingolipid hydroxylase (fatty acid hydroxylase superfamily)